MKNLIIASIALLISSCSTVHYKRAEILERGDSISALDAKIEQARMTDVDILAPDGFSKTSHLLDAAVREAQTSKDPHAGNATALEGIATIDEAQRVSEQNRPILQDTLNARQSAKNVDAHVLFPREFVKLDHRFVLAGKALEGGRQQEGIGKDAGLIAAYENLEMQSTKKSVVEKATLVYDEAVKARARALAPISLGKAKTEIDIAKKIIEVDKDNREKADFHATRGLYLASLAKNISDTLTAFSKEGLTDEGKLLWFQSALARIHQASVPQGVAFDKPIREVFQDLQENVTDLVGKASYLEEAAAVAIAKKDQSLAEQRKKDALFQKITEMFSPTEAEVLKRENDIIIRSYGFNFPVGKTDLLPSNFPLLKKIVNAIKTMPSAQIVVEGHTDSTGPERLNALLSNQRAKNIADYLINVAGIDARRVTAKGFGFDKPLAINKTLKGRAINRRIEIVIKN